MARKYSIVLLVGLQFGLSACGEKVDLVQAEAIVKANCKVCHAQGINGAPIIGNQKMWGPRIEKGKEALVQNAIQGVGLMPPKGGKTQLSKEEISLAIEYFLAELNQ